MVTTSVTTSGASGVVVDLDADVVSGRNDVSSAVMCVLIDPTELPDLISKSESSDKSSETES